MVDQLNLLGDNAQPVDDELGVAQRAVMRVIRRLGTMSWDEAGAIVHAGRGQHGVDDRCEFCGTDGATLCESLVRRGLVEAHRHGYVRLPGGAAVATAESDLL